MQQKIDIKRLIPLLLGPVIFLLTISITPPEGMSEQAQAVLASTLWVAIWWATEVVPLAVTSLLPIILFPLTGALDLKVISDMQGVVALKAMNATEGVAAIKEAAVVEAVSTLKITAAKKGAAAMKLVSANYGHPLLFLFIGGFILALAMEKWNLHRRIALNIIGAVGTNTRMIILGFMLATGFLSMWISNTATTVMMMPIGLAIIHQFREFSLRNEAFRGNIDRFSKALMLSIAYSASIGGVATLVGTPTNIVFRGFVEEFYDVEISFARWMFFATPIAFGIILMVWWYITRVSLPLKQTKIPGIKQEIIRQIKLLGKITREENAVLIVFVLVALAWITRSYLLKPLLPAIDDSIIAVIGCTVLFIIPSREKGKAIMDWETAVKLPWGILILFGAGFAIAQGFQESGLAQWMGDQMSGLEGAPFILILLAITAMVNFLTEINSNMATCTMMMPVLAVLAKAIGVHPYGLMMAAAIAASCAFMLPVATAPNAIVFGTGHIRMKDMIRVGVALNVISILIIVAYVYLVLPPVWGLDLQMFPEGFAK